MYCMPLKSAAVAVSGSIRRPVFASTRRRIAALARSTFSGGSTPGRTV